MSARSGRDEATRAVAAATLVAGLLVAQQAAGRAVRDALFLSVFPLASLPSVMLAASLASIAAAVGFARLLARRSPLRLLPWVAATSGALFLAEWALFAGAPRAAAVALYLHLATFNGVALSAFWSLVNERFDPHTAKQVIGRIGRGASIGGVVGGLAAWGASRLIPVPAMLAVVAACNVAAAVVTTRVGASPERGDPLPASEPAPIAIRILTRVPYLRDLALVVALGAVTDALLDYVLKSQAASLGAAPRLLSFFALLGTALGVVGLLVQAGLSRTSLRTLGLAGSAAIRPATVLGIALLGLVDPRIWAAVLARAGHEINSSSVFRSAYELLFAPLAESEKRPTKVVIDVACDKLGALLGGLVVLGVAALVPGQASRVLFALAAVLCIGALALTGRLHRGYVGALEQSLRAGRVRLDDSDVLDEATRVTVFQTNLALDREALLRELALDAPPAEGDEVLAAVAHLRSGDAARVRAVVTRELTPALAAHAIPLLAWDEVFPDVGRALRRIAGRVTGQLVDALVDPASEEVVRRRLPRVLRACPNLRAVGGLYVGLSDASPAVRAQCAQALLHLTSRHAGLSVARGDAFAAVQREIDSPGETDLDLVFTLLSLALEREPLQIARRALRGTDRTLRGTALEYLHNVLPEGLREAAWPLFLAPALLDHPEAATGASPRAS